MRKKWLFIYKAGSLLKIEMNYLLDAPKNLDNGIKCSTTFWFTFSAEEE